MGTATTAYTTDEIEAAWAEFQRLGARGRDWPAWAALFTDDALYIEHCIGRFRGADGILGFILEAMKPVQPMTFSLDWAIVEAPYVAFNIWNHMPNLGDGVRYSFSNLTLIEYGGNGKWKLEEDFYAPRDSGRIVGKWFKAGGTAAMEPDPSLVHTSLVDSPDSDDRAGVAAMVAAWCGGKPAYTTQADGAVGEVWTHGVGRTPGAETQPFTTPADVVVQDGKRAFLRCGPTGVALTHGGGGRIRFEERAANPTEVA